MSRFDSDASIGEHIMELLMRIRKMVLILVLATVAVLIVPIDLASLNLSWTEPVYNTLATVVINRLLSDLLPSNVQLLPMDWFAPFMIYIYTSLFIGLVISSPVIVYELYKFFSPALYSHERKYILTFTGAFTGLFLFGISMGYFVVVPITFRMLVSSTYLLNLPPTYEFTSFFSIVLGLLTVSGLMFTFPVFFILLVKLGIVKTTMITNARKIVYIGIFIIICIFTPDPTIVTDVILFLPIFVLMEASILIGKRIERQATPK